MSNNPIVLDALSYIGEQIYENIKAQDITERFYISRFYLSKIFQEKLGISIHQFILKKKLFLARQDLLNESSISETYQKYGFGDYSSFYRAFKSEFALSPRNWKSR